MTTPELGSVLIGSTDPERLRDWYAAAFETAPDGDGWLPLGEVGLLITGRDDVAATSPEPQRYIHNFHVTDIDAVAARLETLGVRWVVRPEQREDGVFGTLLDPDGNYLQVIQLTAEYRARAEDERAARTEPVPYSGFSVPDVAAAKAFYAGVLGLDVTEEHGMLRLWIAPHTAVLVYPKADHVPAGFTVLNLPVDDIDSAVDDLVARGVEFVRYEGSYQDEKGVMRGRRANRGPDIAWFTDPGGNILSVLAD